MASDDNRVIIACAGSGKTSRLVREALNATGKRIAIVTYTNNNVRAIVGKFHELNSGVPRHVEVMTWFGFLIRECARPYQRSKLPQGRVEGLNFVNRQSAQRVPESNTIRHYFSSDGRIYSDKLARFVVECQRHSGLLVTRRLQDVYTDIFVDEFQDLAGWDLDVVRALLDSNIRVTLVGDPRQHIYRTNPASKNKQYLGTNITRLVQQWERAGVCRIVQPMSETYRCNQTICNFVNALWPEMDQMKSLTNATSEVEGVFRVPVSAVEVYVQRYGAQILRHNKNAESYGREALNFGVAKGLEFDHVLIVPTDPIRKYLSTGNLRYVESSRDKLHVAVTRARHSVGFAFDGESPIVRARFELNTTAPTSSH